MPDSIVLRLGVLSAAELAALGMGRAAREAAVSDGRLLRIRPGWFATPDADADVVAAARSRGCLSCASALRCHGAWVPASLGRTHVRHARRADGVGFGGCRPFGAAPPVRSAVDDVATAFRCLLRCGTAEDVVVVADSLLHLRLASRADLVAWSTSAPQRVRALLGRVDVAESGLESMVRLRLRARRVRVRTQVWIGGRRADLLVGERLVIECDGAEHHAGWSEHADDRARDRAFAVAGYLVVRLTYRQIVDDWAAVEHDLLALLRRRAHRAPRRAS